MFFSFRKFYNEGASEGAGGTTDVNTDKTEVNNAAPPQASLPEDVARELEELRTFKQTVEASKADIKTPEQIAKEAEVDRANFLKFSTENDLLKVDDYSKYESLKSKADRDLVFEDFTTQYKTENPNADPTTLDQEIKDAFDAQYHLASENKTLKARGEKLLAKEAEALRNPYELKYKTAQERYSEEKEFRNAYPKYEKFYTEKVSKLIPDEVTLFTQKDGETEIPIKVKITAEEKAEIAKQFNNEKTFYNFTKVKDGNTSDFEKSLEKKILGTIRERKLNDAFLETWKAAEGIGLRKGSTTGADNLFGAQQTSSGKQNEAKVITLAESNAKIAQARERYGR